MKGSSYNASSRYRCHAILLFLLAFLIITGYIWKNKYLDTTIFGRKTKTEDYHQTLQYVYENYNNPRQFHHWKEYASHYELHLNLLMGKLETSPEFRMLEIGVRFGGSIEVWKTYFSERNLYYVGMDIEQKCKRFEDEERNIFIKIGSQASQNDLIQICKDHGPFDFIVDDGGHTFDQMKTSINTLFPSDLCMTPQSLYVIEDMHTMVTHGQHSSNIPGIPSQLFERMHYYWYHHPLFEKRPLRNSNENDKKWADRIESISLYDSMMFVHRGTGSGPLTELKKGPPGW